MSRNGSGIYNLPTGNPVVTGTTITSNWANTTLSDLATAMTGSVAADGQTPITGNIQMGNNKITGMANGTSLTDAATVGQAVPTGAILMWSGSIATIPSGWLICDGTNGTPDLRSRFIVGAGSTYAVNATGGTADAIVVAHTHTGTTGGTSNGHTHGITDQVHQHAFVDELGRPCALSALQPGSQNSSPGSNTSTPSYNTQGAYTGITGTNGQSADHTHAFTTNSTGSSGTNANLPPYLALAYIMKA
jgi:hypothetical protein